MALRRLCLGGWLAAMALSTANALRIVLTDWPGFSAAFPGAASPFGHVLAIGLPIALLVALVGLWRWRRWGLWLLGAACVGTLLLDVLADGPRLHLATAIVATAVSTLLLWWNRDGYRSADGLSAGGPAPR